MSADPTENSIAPTSQRHLDNVSEDGVLSNNARGIEESDENAVEAGLPELGTEIPVSASSSARDYTPGSVRDFTPGAARDDSSSSHVGQFASDLAPLDAAESTFNGDPEISGFDLVADAKPDSRAAHLRSRLEARTQDLKEHATHLRDRASDFLQELPAKREALIERGSEFAKTAEQTARRNPWLSVAVASAGALAVGFLLGRAIFGGQPTLPRRDEEEAPVGYDE